MFELLFLNVTKEINLLIHIKNSYQFKVTKMKKISEISYVKSTKKKLYYIKNLDNSRVRMNFKE